MCDGSKIEETLVSCGLTAKLRQDNQRNQHFATCKFQLRWNDKSFITGKLGV